VSWSGSGAKWVLFMIKWAFASVIAFIAVGALVALPIVVLHAVGVATGQH
jgi:hypothetical protein